MTEGIQDSAFPGAVVLAMQGDSILIHKAYGYHTYDSIRQVKTNHIYDLASVTKVTAGTLALMKLYEEGKIKLDGQVGDYVEGFGMNKRGKATIRSTLAHQAGWRPWIPYYQNMRKKNGAWKGKFFRTEYSEKYPIKITDSLYLTNKNYTYIKKQIKKSNFNTSRGYAYSGLFSYLIPEVVENLSGMEYSTFLEDYFYDPLGAETLGFNPLDQFPDSIIAPTEIDTFFRMTPIHGTVHDEGAILMGGLSANAGLFSNAADLAKVWRMFLRGGMA